ncbi:MAG: ABC transporter ATP-binding protein [Planctomycetota bacterium]|nr:ABC transporter ATP-binding protein [Planctomycetota bacterium]
MAFVEIDNLWVTYGKFSAVKGISMQIPKGEVFGFIGPNGAGKSSTFKVLATLLKPTRGKVTLDGISVPDNPRAIRRRIGYMPDFFGVYEDLTANEYLHFFAAAFRIERDRRQRTVDDVLALTDLTGKRDAQVDTLSRGMKQRLGLARVLLHDPDLLLLDEPASGLDPRARIEMRELLKELRKMGKTILISSHILHELAHLCTRIGIIEQGQLIAQGSLEEIYAQLTLMRLIHVQIVNTSPELIQKVRGIEGVASVEEEIDRVAIRLHEDRLTAEDLLGKLHELGAKVRMFQPDAMDMETAFMKLTQGKVA